jgi:hypothetical protein
MARKKSQEEILTLAVQKHNNYYTYEHAVYVDSKTKFQVTCPNHGPFWITPNNHLSGKGCSKCGDVRTASSKQKTTSVFTNQVEERFPGKYDFSCTLYKSARAKVDVRCTEHDIVFQITPDNLLRGKGCPLCGIASRVNTRKAQFDEMVPENERRFAEDILKVHGGRYEYLGGYRTKESLVSLLCKDHGEFKQKALDHIGGCGCPSCADYGFNPAKSGTVYVMQDGELVKVGITNRAANIRLRNIKRSSSRNFSVVCSFNFDQGHTARDIETALLRELRSQYEQPTEKFDGSTECFYNVNLPALLARIEELIKEHTCLSSI